jgi:hypothetical protein
VQSSAYTLVVSREVGVKLSNRAKQASILRIISSEILFGIITPEFYGNRNPISGEELWLFPKSWALLLVRLLS